MNVRKNSLAVVVAGFLLLLPTHANAGLVVATGGGSITLPAWFKVLGIGVVVCAAGLVSSAWAKNLTQNQPLTPQQAATCGFSFFFTPPPAPR